MVELPGNIHPKVGPVLPSNATALGPDHVVRLALRLRRDPAHHAEWTLGLINATLPDLSRRSFLTAQRISELDTAAADDINKVLDFARRHGLRVVDQSNSREIMLEGPLSAVEHAVGGGRSLGLVEFNRNGITHRTHLRTPRVPRALSGAVEGVLMRNLRRADPRFRVETAAVAGGAKNSRQWADHYQAQNSSGQPLRADGVTVAIVTFGGGFDQANYEAACRAAGVPVAPIQVVSVGGAALNYTGDPNSADVENHLDLAAVAGAAPGVKIKLFVANNTNQGMVDVLNAIARDPDVSVASMSWGDKLANYTPAEAQAVQDGLQAIALAGISFFNSAGDNGDRERGMRPQPDFPACSEWVTAAVGTLEPGGPSQAEVWNDLAKGGGATGCGISPFPKPAWQNFLPGTERHYGDWPAVAAPATGCVFPFAGKDITVGGTSLSSPLEAGFTGCMVAAAGQKLGLMNPLIYQWLGTDIVWDVSKGGTEDFPSKVGYDEPSGIGTVNIGKANSWVLRHLPVKSSGPSAPTPLPAQDQRPTPAVPQLG